MPEKNRLKSGSGQSLKKRLKQRVERKQAARKASKSKESGKSKESKKSY